MLIGTVVVILLVGCAGFFFGMKNGKERTKKRWEDNIRYITVKGIEEMAAEMRANGADDDSIMVIVKHDWLENEK